MTVILALLLCLALAGLATYHEALKAARKAARHTRAQLLELAALLRSGECYRATRRLKDWELAIAWLAIAGLVCLDAHGPHVGRHAEIFSFVGAAFEIVKGFFEVVGAAVEATLAAVVSALAASVAWLLGALRTFMFATGSVFAKAWDGLKVVWNDALKPALSWVDRTITRVRTWLTNTFAPVFNFLKHVRDALKSVWNRFLRPILDTIDFVHQLDKLLQVFHIDVLEGLDNTLQAFESKVQEGFLWVTSKLNDISNVLTTIITADGFFQRYTHLRTMARDVSYHWHILANGARRELSGDESYRITRAFETPSVAVAIDATAAWLNGEASDDQASLDAAVATWSDFAQTSDDAATA